MLSFFLIALILTTYSCGENPAIRITLTNNGLQYGRHIGAGWVQERLENMSIPDVCGRFRLGFLGYADYTLSGITVSRCDFPEPSVEFYKNATGFKASITGLSIAVKGWWRTRFRVIHDHGSFDLAVFNVDVTSIVELGRYTDGHLSISSYSCTAAVGDVRMDFHGGASWIFQPFVNHFRGRIKGQIEKKICPAVEEHIVNLEYYLQAMKVSFQVGPDLAVDVPLTNSPFVDSSSLGLGLKGEFYSIRSHADPPFEAQPFTLPERPDYMLSVGLSEFTTNSASYGYYSAGLLQALINDSMIPPSSPFHLNTSSFGPLIPQLPKLFPGLLMQLQVYAREVPMFSFQPGAVRLGFLGAVKASAIQTNTTLTPLFTLNVDSTFSGKVWISAGRLNGSMAMDNLTLTLAATEVGPFKIAALENLVRMAIKMCVLTKLNEKLAEGFVLPSMQHTRLVNTVLNMEEGFIAISSDVEVWSAERGPYRERGRERERERERGIQGW